MFKMVCVFLAGIVASGCAIETSSVSEEVLSAGTSSPSKPPVSAEIDVSVIQIQPKKRAGFFKPLPPTSLSAHGQLIIGTHRICGAVAISSHIVLTAAHCIGQLDFPPNHINGDDVKKGWLPENSRPTQVKFIDRATDVALLDTFVELPTWLPVRATVANEPAWVVTNREGGFKFLHEETTQLQWWDSLPVQHGDSGSAVLGADGAVIGVVSTCFNADENDNCGGGGTWASAEHVLAALATLESL